MEAKVDIFNAPLIRTGLGSGTTLDAGAVVLVLLDWKTIALVESRAGALLG